jgi:hypothetical protein
MKQITSEIGLIEFNEFDALLSDLENRKNNISIRLQVKGEPWMENFSTVLVYSRNEIILGHLPTRTVKYVKSMKEVAGFEIDHPHTMFNSFERYYVVPSLEETNSALRYG